ncbi:MAG: bifunctional adenosylcobinamide kinase/adenosylcobinamide-phosphate guanylyltransferase [Chloroflexi bacterium]|nr:bifunctional adenosylcobinamide kinase/adenosylcobinamide-phosphate guanylyltransferase [Chloroflexota bacterium]
MLVTGGSRSGKSRYALSRAAALSDAVLFVATGVETDAEMAARIARHRAERPANWATVEARYELGTAVTGVAAPGTTVLVEDVGTLVTYLLVAREASEADVLAEINQLVGLKEVGYRLVVVTAEVGLGVVPATPLARGFRDLLGLANQRLATVAEEVVFLVSGLPLTVKARPGPTPPGAS